MSDIPAAQPIPRSSPTPETGGPIALRPADLVGAMDLDLLSRLCGCPVAPDLRRAVAGSRRLRERIGARAVDGLGLPARVEALDGPVLRRMAFGPHAEVERLLLLAGALGSSGAIRRAVDRAAVARLRAAMGPDLYAMVLDQGGAPTEGGTAPTDRGGLRAAGMSCLAEWLRARPEGLAALLATRLGADDRDACRAAEGPPGGDRRIEIAAEMLDARA